MRRRIDPEPQKRNSTGRAIIKLLRSAPEIFDSGDNVLFLQEDSRLGMWIGVKPTRHVDYSRSSRRNISRALKCTGIQREIANGCGLDTSTMGAFQQK